MKQSDSYKGGFWDSNIKIDDNLPVKSTSTDAIKPQTMEEVINLEDESPVEDKLDTKRSEPEKLSMYKDPVEKAR
jgi:vesicle coat complex subunit